MWAVTAALYYSSTAIFTRSMQYKKPRFAMKKILPKFAFSLRSASDYIGKINLREVVKSVAKERELVAFAFRYSFLTSLDFRICSLASDTELCTVVCHPIRVLHKR